MVLKKLIKGLWVFVAFGNLSHAAAPGMHIYLAGKLLENIKPAPEVFKPLYVGTLWPDIRYLNSVRRVQTHDKKVSLNALKSVTAENAFEVGKKLHAYVDEVREKFAVSYGIYNLIADVPQKYQKTFLKFIEDEIIWDKLNRAEISRALQNTYPQEEAQGHVSKMEVLLWHGVLMYYFQQRPVEIFLKAPQVQEKFFRVPAKELERWCKLLEDKSQDPRLIEYVESLLNHFDEQFSSLIQTGLNLSHG